MKLLVLLSGLASICAGQLIFPDQFEAMQEAAKRLQFATPKQVVAEQAPILSNAFGVVSASPVVVQSEPYPVIPLEQPWGKQANDVISKGIVKFTLDMGNAVSNVKGRSIKGIRENVIFSPLSVASALALVLLGSAGKTFDEVSKILGLESGVDVSKNSELVHQMFGLLLSAVDARMPAGPQTAIASGIFVQVGYPIRREFKEISEKDYKSEVINLDFRNSGGQAQKIVNTWVNDRTRGKINRILEGLPNPDTSVIIASALYFNAEWEQHFIDGSTRRRPFNVAPGQTVEVDMMYNGGTFPFFEDKQLQAKIVGLPYKGGETTMYVVLPNAKDVEALRKLEVRLNADNLEDLINNMRNESCILGLPRMKLSSSLSLSDALRSLGLNSLFDPSTADLSLLSPGRNLTMTKQPVQPTPRPELPTTSDGFIFSRFGDKNETDASQPGSAVGKRNFISYVDTVGGYKVEQWANGFSISRIRREIREKQRRHSMRATRSIGVQDGTYDDFEYAGASDRQKRQIYERDLERQREPLDLNMRTRQTRQNGDTYRIPDESEGIADHVQVVRLGESKYRFGKKEETAGKRSKRQVRPINGDFINFMKSQSLQSYGLDNLRNSGTLRNPGLYADDVLHRVEIDVTETGTEAAAATAVLLTKDGNYRRLVADRPFLFFIRHESTKLILFWGTVYTPTPNYTKK